jgi:transposase
MEPTYSSNQAAQMVGVKPASLRVLIFRLKERGRAEVGSIEGKTRRFTESDIAELRQVREEKGIWSAP